MQKGSKKAGNNISPPPLPLKEGLRHPTAHHGSRHIMGAAGSRWCGVGSAQLVHTKVILFLASKCSYRISFFTLETYIYICTMSTSIRLSRLFMTLLRLCLLEACIIYIMEKPAPTHTFVTLPPNWDCSLFSYLIAVTLYHFQLLFRIPQENSSFGQL